MDGSRCGIDVPKWSCHNPLTGAVLMQITTIGLDLAKHALGPAEPDPGERLSASRRRRWRPSDAAQAVVAPATAGVLRQPAALPGRHGSLRQRPFLGEGAGKARARRAADAGFLRSALRQA